MNDINQNINQTQTSPQDVKLKELWDKIEAANLTADELQKATNKAHDQRLTNSQIEKLRAELKKQADVTLPTKP